MGDGIPNNSKYDCYSLNFDVVFAFAKAVSIILPPGQRETLALYVTRRNSFSITSFHRTCFTGFRMTD